MGFTIFWFCVWNSVLFRKSVTYIVGCSFIKTCNVPSNIVYSAIGAESLRIARASNNPESFCTAIKPLIARMNRQGLSIGKRNSSILKIFDKHYSDFNNVCQSKQEFLNLIS